MSNGTFQAKAQRSRARFPVLLLVATGALLRSVSAFSSGESERGSGRAEQSGKSDDIVVFITRHDGRCTECHEEFFRGNLIRVENGNPLCLECADLGHLEFLPRGDTAVTRRAGKLSPLRAVVVEWSRSRQHYERQGILATPQAIAQAEIDSLADAEVRERQEIRGELDQVLARWERPMPAA